MIQEMVALTQEDLPYLVLTEDPNLQAYRTDRLAQRRAGSARRETGDLFCEQVSLRAAAVAGARRRAPRERGRRRGRRRVVVVIAAVGRRPWPAFLVRPRSRRRRDGEPLELEDVRRDAHERALAGRQDRRRRC